MSDAILYIVKAEWLTTNQQMWMLLTDKYSVLCVEWISRLAFFVSRMCRTGDGVKCLPHEAFVRLTRLLLFFIAKGPIPLIKIALLSRTNGRQYGHTRASDLLRRISVGLVSRIWAGGVLKARGTFEWHIKAFSLSPWSLTVTHHLHICRTTLTLPANTVCLSYSLYPLPFFKG